ncbi:hypothetical protein P692DRAFT_20478329 [Suillus brevipes Sb2]|nr:hypothetical protein P692DRAFT_20478329 [Suillus brevipes Sb2]
MFNWRCQRQFIRRQKSYMAAVMYHIISAGFSPVRMTGVAPRTIPRPQPFVCLCRVHPHSYGEETICRSQIG